MKTRKQDAKTICSILTGICILGIGGYLAITTLGDMDSLPRLVAGGAVVFLGSRIIWTTY